MGFNKEIFFDLINIYGESYFIHFKTKYKHQTRLGIFFGVISLLTFIILSFVFFFEIFNRSHFSLFIYNQQNNNSYINLTNTPFIFTVIDSNGNFIPEDKKLFKLEVIYINNTINETINIPLKNCSDISYKDILINNFEIKESYNKIGNYLCLNYNDQILLKDLLTNNKSNLEIKLKICNNNSNEECYNEKELENKLINGYFIMGYIDNFIDHYNFKKPIQNKIRYEIFRFSIYINKFISYVFEESYYESDSGFIFPIIKSTHFFEFKDYNIDFKVNNDNGNLLEIKFYNNYKCTFYKRKYKKIQDCVSTVESYINSIYKCCSIFIFLSSRKIIYRDLINNLILGDEPIRKVKSFKLNSILNDSNENKSNINSNSLQNINDNCKCFISPMLIKSNSNSKNIKKKITNNLYKKISTELSLINDNIKNDKSNIKLINFKHYQYFLPTFIESNNKNIIIFNKLKDIICRYISIETIYKTCNLVYDKKIVKNLIKHYKLLGEKV